MDNTKYCEFVLVLSDDAAHASMYTSMLSD